MRPFYRIGLLATTFLLCSCVGMPSPPPGLDTDRTFTSSVSTDYQDAYRAVARRSTVCFGQGGLLSINHVVQSDIDAVAKVGRIEVLPSGLLNQEARDADRKSYVTRVVAIPSGAEVATTGPTRQGAYLIHLVNMQWIAGIPDCAYQRP